MKVIRLSTFLDYGGIESKMVKIAGCNSEDIEFIYVSLGKGGEAERKIHSTGRRVICLEVDHKIPSLSAVSRLCKLIKIEKPDVVHCAGAEANFHGVLAAKLIGVKVVIAEEIGIPSQGKFAKVVFAAIYSLSDCLVVESRFVLRFLRNFYRGSKFDIKVINNFIEPPDVVAKALRGGAVKGLLSVSRLEPVKAIDKVLYALARLRNEGFCFRYDVVGSGSQESYLRKLAGQLGLGDIVEFHGFKNNVEKFYQSSDVFILNSVSEGASNSLLEALSFGLPSITTVVGAAEDLINPGCNGWLVEHSGSEEVYKAIKAALEVDPYSYSVMSELAIESIRNGFSFRSYLNSLKKIYALNS